jgi:hypothetical protein
MFKVQFTLDINNAEYSIDFHDNGVPVNQANADEELYAELDQVRVVLKSGNYSSIDDIMTQARALSQKYQVGLDRISINQLL